MKKGFSLIEIIVSITIIAVLVSVGIVSFSSLTKKSRDAKRKSDLEQIRAALEMYKADNGTYKVAGSGYGGNGNGWFNTDAATYPSDAATVLINEGYLSTEPIDPTQGNEGYMIYLCNSNYSYALYATLESPTAEESAYAASGTPCNSPVPVNSYGKNYAIINP